MKTYYQKYWFTITIFAVAFYVIRWVQKNIFYADPLDIVDGFIFLILAIGHSIATYIDEVHKEVKYNKEMIYDLYSKIDPSDETGDKD